MSCQSHHRKQIEFVVIWAVSCFLFSAVTVRAEPVGFRDLRIGVTGETFQNNCEHREIVTREFTCYGIEDLLFEWWLPELSLGQVPGAADKVEVFSIVFFEPYMQALAKEGSQQFFEELYARERIEWATEKYLQLQSDLSAKYEMNWVWDDPNAPGRKERVLERYWDESDRRIYDLATVFEGGRVVLTLEEPQSGLPPQVKIFYRSDSYAENYVDSLAEFDPHEPVQPSKATDHSEF